VLGQAIVHELRANEAFRNDLQQAKLEVASAKPGQKVRQLEKTEALSR